jgi:hypothetical protein
MRILFSLLIVVGVVLLKLLLLLVVAVAVVDVAGVVRVRCVGVVVGARAVVLGIVVVVIVACDWSVVVGDSV